MIKQFLLQDLFSIDNDKKYFDILQSKLPFLLEHKKYILQVLEDHQLPYGTPYHIDEIRHFEQINMISLPYQLKFYLTNISKIIFELTTGHGTLFSIYQEYNTALDDEEFKPILYKTCSLDDFPNDHFFHHYLDSSQFHPEYNKCDYFMAAIYCHITSFNYPKLTPIVNDEWKTPSHMNHLNLTFSQEFIQKYCDKCQQYMGFGDFFYSNDFYIKPKNPPIDFYLDLDTTDYCEKCFLENQNTLSTPNNNFFKMQSKFCILHPTHCSLCQTPELTHYFIVPLYLDTKTYEYCKQLLCDYVCESCIYNRYNIPADTCTQSYSGSMKLLHTRCDEYKNIILNGKYRGSITGAHIKFYGLNNPIYFLHKSFFDMIWHDTEVEFSDDILDLEYGNYLFYQEAGKDDLQFRETKEFLEQMKEKLYFT